MRTLPAVKQLGAEMKVFHQLDMGPRPTCVDCLRGFMRNVKSSYEMLQQCANTAWRDNTALGATVEKGASEEYSSIGSSIPDRVALETVREIPLIDRVECELLQRENDVVTFGHNDLQPGNILVGADGKMSFIDFEYARHMPRGYDVANQWCEWAADYLSDTPHLMDYSKGPTQEQERAFARAYLEFGADAAISEKAVSTFIEDEVKTYVPLSHLWWGVWGMLQACNTSEGDKEDEFFDYLGYGMCRLEALKAFTE